MKVYSAEQVFYTSINPRLNHLRYYISMVADLFHGTFSCSEAKRRKPENTTKWRHGAIRGNTPPFRPCFDFSVFPTPQVHNNYTYIESLFIVHDRTVPPARLIRLLTIQLYQTKPKLTLH